MYTVKHIDMHIPGIPKHSNKLGNNYLQNKLS